MNNINRIVKDNLCMSCGVCEAACPFGAISMYYEHSIPFPIIEESNCRNCGRCLRMCPGKGIDLKNFIFDKERKYSVAGRVEESFTGYSTNNNLRYCASSGGSVTSFLLYLLDKHIVDGALVTTFMSSTMSSKTFIAKTSKDIINSKGSKYVVTSINKALEDLKSEPSGKYVVVGLPCQIQGIRKLKTLDKDLNSKIIGLFGLYCSVNKTKNALDYYCKRLRIKPIDFSFRTDGYLGYMKINDGSREVKIKYEEYWHGTHSFFVNERCALCKDHFAELADISFGDINIPPYNKDKIGINSIIVRSNYWLDKIKEAEREGYLSLNHTPLSDIIKSQPYATIYKKGVGLQATLRIYKLLGRKIPDFTYIKMSVPIKEYLKQSISLLMRSVGRHKSSYFLISLFDHSKAEKQ